MCGNNVAVSVGRVLGYFYTSMIVSVRVVGVLFMSMSFVTIVNINLNSFDFRANEKSAMMRRVHMGRHIYTIEPIQKTRKE